MNPYNILAFWVEKRNRRDFFENFGKENSFDTLVPSQWYSNLTRLKATKVSTTLIVLNSFYCVLF
jgi:hypothetical protein